MTQSAQLVARSLAGMMIRDKPLMLWTAVLVTSALLMLVGNIYAERGGFVLWAVAIAFAFMGTPNFLQDLRDMYFTRADGQAVSRLLDAETDDVEDIEQYLREIRRYPLVRDLEIIDEHRLSVAATKDRAASEAMLKERVRALGS